MNEHHRIEAVRFRYNLDSKGKPKGYSHSYGIGPEGDEQILYTCDIIRHVTSRETVFKDATGAPCFSMRPNRKIMPTRWPLTDAEGRSIGLLNQKVVKKAAWVAFGPANQEVFRIVDVGLLKEKILAGIFDDVAFKWVLMQEGKLAGQMKKEARNQVKKKGLRGFFNSLTTSSDWVVRFTPDSPTVDTRLLAAGMVLFIDITTPVH